MQTTAQSRSEESVEISGSLMHLMTGGTGDPVVVLHHDIGSTGWTSFHDRLAGGFSVTAPTHLGYGQSERPAWMRSVRDMAVAHQWLLRSRGIESATLVGLGFGGWVAAEMATMAPGRFKGLVLVGAMGVKPEQGDILDQALMGHIDYVRAGFHNQDVFDATFGADPETEQLEEWEISREMTFRIAWKPYMFNPALPRLLGGIDTPTLVVWGDDDRVVPRESADLYTRAIPGARVEIVQDCGHYVDLEQPEALARLVETFAAGK
jgi:pimeloyl-ACP methyl ester carboxylesterase